MAIALVLVLVVAGSILFHLLSPWWWTPIASNWDYIDNTIIITFWITGIVFAAVVLFMAYCVWRFRHREGNTRPLRAGEQEAGMVADRDHRRRRHRDAGSRPVRLEPVRHRAHRRDRGRGRRPAMAVELSPARQGRQARHLRHAQRHRRKSARPDRRAIRTARTTSSSRRPTCICRSASRSRCCCARSTCCTISTCREFRAKMDMIPGSVTYYWFTPTRTGSFEVLCAELCGQGHAFMRGVGRWSTPRRTIWPGSASSRHSRN